MLCASPPLLEQTVGAHFANIVSQFGDRTAVVSRHQQVHLSYGELDERSNALARGLLKRGVVRGDRVAVSLGNNIEFATVTYALFKLGAILVPLNPAFNVAQVVSALNHLTASHLIIGTETPLPRKDPRSNIPLLTHIVPNLSGQEVESALVPSLRNIIIVENSRGRVAINGFRCLTDLNDVEREGMDGRSLSEQHLDPHDVVNIQFTSGTTSMPKAACLTHRSILNNGKSIGDRMKLTEKDVVCCPPPLFHCFGCILGYMATATHGSAIVFPAEAFNALASINAVQEYSCTALYGVPTMFIAELELLASGAVPRTGLSQLRTGIAAGSSIPANLMRKLHKDLNLTELTICYGMTETSPVSAMTTTDDPIEKRIETVGRLLPHVKAKVVDPANRAKILEVDQRGELVVSGYITMKGYWGDEEKTAEVLVPDSDGVMWMHTGDEAMIDEEGYVTITGRIKDLIIKGGENIHPLEVENCLLAHPAVSEISVVGLPDERYGEAVAAFVVLHKDVQASKEDFQDWVREKLSHHLVPKYFFWVDNYPKTASGKIKKFKLKELGIQLLRG
ncbi:acyl-CoA synthetase/AMP-acid ligase-like protein II [Saccharata proteae CBS 121410]|uniref:Acyl-CoA synthetase/AMP-acid ligase-like protein II n=1 Tax=Saccharata proteae CBS 121410 TaxID=1314787 RepID=A0A9P4HT68_9PEZI|nr:acyl-CoA synthetase/AMP-acid ligase-like protein II [Saccharata proteae CBS 121410]